jgi:hypothetical protein
MGYTIPSGDYSLPPLQVNVGAELGKSFGSALANMGARKEQKRKEAAQLLKDQNATKNTIAITQAEAQRKFGSDLQKKGVSQILIQQYSDRIKQKGDAAMKAQLDMAFGQEMTDEERMQNAKTVADVTSYTENTLTQIGAFGSDIDLVNDTDYVVYGDDTNGEQFANTLGLNAFKGNMIASDAIINGNLTGEGNINDVGSTVSIPVDSPFWNTVNSEGGATVKDQVEIGLDAEHGRITQQEIDGKQYYTFTTDINLNNYESAGGVDLVQKKLKTLESDKTFQETNLMDETGAWSETYIDKNPITTSNFEVDADNKPTGYKVTTSYNILDVNAMIASKPYQDGIKAEYDAKFNSSASPPISRFIQQNYLREIGSSLDMNSEEWKGMTPDARRTAVMSGITEKLWENYFPPSKNNQGDGDSQEQMVLGKDTPIGILTQAKSMTNPLTNLKYREGDTIYLMKNQRTRIDEENTDNGNDGTSIYQLIKGKYNKAFQAAEGLVAAKNTAGLKAIKNSMTGVPLTLPDGRGKYEVDASGNIRLVAGTDPRLYKIVSDEIFLEALNDAIKSE